MKEFIYDTPPSSPTMGNLYIPETPEEVYSCDKERYPVISRTRRAQVEVLGKIDPQLHDLIKSLFPRYFGRPSSTKFEGFFTSKSDIKDDGVEITSCAMEANAESHKTPAIEDDSEETVAVSPAELFSMRTSSSQPFAVVTYSSEDLSLPAATTIISGSSPMSAAASSKLPSKAVSRCIWF